MIFFFFFCVEFSFTLGNWHCEWIWADFLKWGRERRFETLQVMVLIVGGGWFRMEQQLYSSLLGCLHCWSVWPCHCTLTPAPATLQSLGTLRLRDIGWRLPLTFRSRNGIETAPAMISAIGDSTTHLWLPTRVSFMAFFLDSSILSPLLFSLPEVTSPILGAHFTRFSFPIQCEMLFRSFEFYMYLACNVVSIQIMSTI